jgi:hypothetical protein
MDLWLIIIIDLLHNNITILVSLQPSLSALLSMLQISSSLFGQILSQTLPIRGQFCKHYIVFDTPSSASCEYTCEERADHFLLRLPKLKIV